METKITVPTSLSEITLRQYKHFLEIQEKNTEDRFLNAKMIEIFCDIKLEQVMLLQLKDSAEITSIISKMFEEKPSLVTMFNLNGVEYGFHPQLDEITLGEYVDLDTFIGDWPNIEKAMNVLYRPVIAKLKGKYSIEDYKTGAEGDILDMPMDAVLSSIFFLWNLGLDLSKTMTNSLDNRETEILTQYLNTQESGDGINQFTDLLKETLQDLKISLQIMANQGVRGFYQLTETIKTALLQDININTVTTGDITDVNLNKQDIFPLGHIIINNVIDTEQTLRFNITILACDIVNQSKDPTVDRFTGNNDVQDILNTQLAVLNKLIQRLRMGNLFTDMYQLDSPPSLEPFYDRFENQLAGWSATMDILIYNDIWICD